MTEPDGNGLAQAQGFEVPNMQDDSLPGSNVHHAYPKVEVLDTRVSRVPDVSIGGGGVEIRREAAHLVVEVLEDWIKQQNRRIEFIRRGGVDAEGRRQIQAIQGRIGVAYRVLQAWDQAVREGGLTVPRPEVVDAEPEN